MVIAPSSPALNALAPAAIVKLTPPVLKAVPTTPVPTASPEGSATLKAVGAVNRIRYVPSRAPAPTAPAMIVPLPVLSTSSDAMAEPMARRPSTVPVIRRPLPLLTTILSRLQREPLDSSDFSQSPMTLRLITLFPSIINSFRELDGIDGNALVGQSRVRRSCACRTAKSASQRP